MPSLIEEEHWPTSQSVLASTQYPRIEAENDYQAVRLWLAEYRDSPQTLKSYRREAERLLLWLASQGKGLCDMNREALRQFEAFLEDPQPRAAWVGPSKPREQKVIGGHSQILALRSDKTLNQPSSSLLNHLNLCSTNEHAINLKASVSTQRIDKLRHVWNLSLRLF